MFPGAHVLAGFSLGLRYRRELRRLLKSTREDANILKLDLQTLHSSGIAAVALDFDGVLAHHASPVPFPEAIVWMKHCQTVFGGERIFILSNKPTEGRRLWFAEHFPAMRFISGVRKKPYPDGLIKAAELGGVPLSAVLMVDDRLLTGCLAALVAGARPCYIRRPYVSLNHRPFAEMFFGLLRTVERLFIRITSLL
jgi:predicted HAD superfamily phosphohydrolase YqeG